MSELITNGTMEADSNWNNLNTPTTNERSSTQALEGTYSRKFIADSQYDGLESDAITVVNGSTYKSTIWVYGDGTNAIAMNMTLSGGASIYFPLTGLGVGYIPPTRWVKHLLVWKAAGTSYTLQVESDTGITAGTHYIDLASVKEHSLLWNWFHEIFKTG